MNVRKLHSQDAARDTLTRRLYSDTVSITNEPPSDLKVWGMPCRQRDAPVDRRPAREIERMSMGKPQ